MKFRWQSTGAHSGPAGDAAAVNKQKLWPRLKRRHTLVAAGALVAGAFGIGASVLASPSPSSTPIAASAASVANPAGASSPVGPETAFPLHTDGGNIVDAAGRP